jgi:hypothetical protein
MVVVEARLDEEEEEKGRIRVVTMVQLYYRFFLVLYFNAKRGN